MSARIFRSLAEARGHFGPCALAIGNFDGVHIGHQRLIADTVQAAAASDLIPAVITFDPHPMTVVAPERTPALICSVEERLRLIEAAGARHMLLLEFTQQLAQLSPEAFVADVLVNALDSKVLLVGENFRFGHRQAGTSEVLKALGKTYGFSACFLPPVRFGDQIVSSTAIRSLLATGDVAQAAHLLGRWYSLKGPVISGRGIGSKQTVPTLNLKYPSGLQIPPGIFVTETREPATGRRWDSVTSCGHNPTFGATELTVETYLLTRLEGATPENIEVEFRHFLRAEQTYPDAASLKAQIMRDVAEAEAYWQLAEKLMPPTPSIY